MVQRARQPGLVDVFVGRQVRRLRQQAGWTLEQMADRLELTIQQVQKYETGENRISVGRLREMADVLGQPVAVFFEGAEVIVEVSRAAGPALAADVELQREVCDMAIAFLSARSLEERAQMRAAIMSAVRKDRAVEDRSAVVFQLRPVGPRRAVAAMWAELRAAG